MRVDPSPNPVTHTKLPYSGTTTHHLISSTNGQHYAIQISTPLDWAKTLDVRSNNIPVVYLLDGNTVFLTASEICWRGEMSPFFCGGAIVVAIGYTHDPTETKSLYNIIDRSYDYTLPEKEINEAATSIRTGGVDEFLDFVERDVKALVRREFPDITIAREAFFGHSFGALCAVHALFTGRAKFDVYYACSPSIWWAEESVLEEEARFLGKEIVDSGKGLPELQLMYGSLELTPIRRSRESDERWEERRQTAEARRMGGNIDDMYERLKRSTKFSKLGKYVFEGDHHGSVVNSALGRCLTAFLEEE
ncbi:hypothetical protein BU24DRAFT_427000 [Aaosphaeria arxii CBS 175.79]|uniref:Siderophore esterase IroE-like protein n=1 Tax=Aaosphaeria arxii CBS 175.79 TaxID=1450172 RepID=A0A6A5XDB4_9PLEO|nr:uncharacterized protein BU24DRAFT_427000 [Aaosphaeria arxii CBS 175.79]KAF2010796.1 hypothetical protein BU24DRAFT_427000 [Aaosphaeria arxii CBS 175.79]